MLFEGAHQVQWNTTRDYNVLIQHKNVHNYGFTYSDAIYVTPVDNHQPHFSCYTLALPFGSWCLHNFLVCFDTFRNIFINNFICYQGWECNHNSERIMDRNDSPLECLHLALQCRIVPAHNTLAVVLSIGIMLVHFRWTGHGWVVKILGTILGGGVALKLWCLHSNCNPSHVGKRS